MTKAISMAFIPVSLMLVLAIGLFIFGVSGAIPQKAMIQPVQSQASIEVQSEVPAELAVAEDPSAFLTASEICHLGGKIGPCKEEALTPSEVCHLGGQHGPCLSEAILPSTATANAR